MANQEQLEILKQGVGVWNRWRVENPDVEIDLSEARLRGTYLRGANLIEAILMEADLTGADLSGADLTGANLTGVDLQNAYLANANLTRADLKRADLSGASFIGARLSAVDFLMSDPGKADLKRVDITRADIVVVDLTEARLIATDFTDAHLIGVNFNYASLSGSNFRRAFVGMSIFRNSDLREAIGLDEVRHVSPSSISTDTFSLSKGKIPESFLRGCGLSDWEIESAKLYNPDLSNDEFIDIQNRIFDLRNRQAIQISPLFISYSHADSEFVDKVGESLTEKGIRYWRDIHDMKSGRIEKQIDRAIRHNPTVLLILSEKSIKSDWVEHEVRTARELEKELGRDTLCPVALDDSWKDSPWPKRIMEQVMEYNILDFSEWENDSKFEGMFRRLIDGLELFYKG
jgi:uncharacterized protein YjbI with pentapeptide repeats